MDPRACNYISVVAKIQLKSQQQQNPITISSKSDKKDIREYHKETSTEFFSHLPRPRFLTIFEKLATGCFAHLPFLILNYLAWHIVYALSIIDTLRRSSHRKQNYRH
jgi:hypothetical protein